MCHLRMRTKRFVSFQHSLYSQSTYLHSLTRRVLTQISRSAIKVDTSAVAEDLFDACMLSSKRADAVNEMAQRMNVMGAPFLSKEANTRLADWLACLQIVQEAKEARGGFRSPG